MTTTLRPAEPLQFSDDGGRSRRYQVCVNGRPVGAVHLATRPDFAPATAVVRELYIERAERGRGRGAIAALAAEEVARTWGCTGIQVSVPAGPDTGEHALGFATALGYVERSRNMAKPLGAAEPALPPGTRSRPMCSDEYPSWLADRSREYARSWTERGVPESDARAKAERDHARLLPHGLATRDTLLSVLEHEDTPVGTLWLALRDDDGFVLDVEVDRAHRGKGHGRSLMLLAEHETIRAGRDRIGLHVFAGNAPALGLYVSLGYRPTRYHLYKPLL